MGVHPRQDSERTRRRSLLGCYRGLPTEIPSAGCTPTPVLSHALDPKACLLKALILAAGRGHRLRPYTDKTPKCLLAIEEGESILQRQIRLLLSAGVDRIVVVAGFGFSDVRACTAKDPRVQVIYNPFFDVADNLISLWAARSHMDEDLLIVNGDNVFHPDIPARLLQSIAPECQLLVQRKTTYDADDMKVTMRAGVLHHIGKDLTPEMIDAESIGLLAFRGRGVEHLYGILEEAVQAERAMSSYYLDGIQRLAHSGIAIHCVDAGTLPWADVDTPADLRWVRRQIRLFGPDPQAFGQDHQAMTRSA